LHHSWGAAILKREFRPLLGAILDLVLVGPGPGRGGQPYPVTDRKGQGEAATVRPRFAHESEAEFARLLDFYGIRWEYEPRSFPLQWDAHGRVVESFNPDFYLPDMELYLELTTLKQSLVTRKNRKVRRLRTLYPDVRLKIFYGRDFRSLLFKYGLARPDTH